MSGTAVKQKAKGSAAGQYLGFALQEVRLFYHLLTCPPDADVGLEYVDDVSVHIGDQTVRAEQCKSSLSGNPISNWSPEFWKTLANWLDNIESGHLQPETTAFQMYVVPIKNAGFAGHLSSLSTDAEIDTALADIDKRYKKLTKIPACEDFYLKVFNADRDTVRNVIRNFTLLNFDTDPFASIYAHLDATLRPAIMEAAVKYGIGDAKRFIDEAIRAGNHPLLRASDFRKRFHAFISAHDNERFLHSLSETPSDEIIETTLLSSPYFVRQLELIEAGIGEKTRATSDFLRSTSDRTHWAEAGLVFENSMNDYDSALLRRHQNLKTEVGLAHASLTEKKQGHLLYVKCCNSSNIPLEGRVVPEHFLPGSLNQLSDRREIGWHPDFDKLLDEES